MKRRKQANDFGDQKSRKVNKLKKEDEERSRQIIITFK